MTPISQVSPRCICLSKAEMARRFISFPYLSISNCRIEVAACYQDLTGLFGLELTVDFFSVLFELVISYAVSGEKLMIIQECILVYLN